MTRRLLILLAFLLTACNFPQATPTASTPTENLPPVSTPVLGEIETPIPTDASEPTPLPPPLSDVPLGTETNPIVLAVLPSSGREMPPSARDVAAQLSYLTGLVIVPYAPASYTEVLDAMGKGQIHVAFLAPFPYLFARERGIADIALATTVFGQDLSAAQFLVNRQMVENRTFTVYFDPLTGANFGEASLALAQFKDKKPCWTDSYSPTGYIVPLGVLNENKVELKEGAFVQGHATVIKSLYSDPEGNICQFGATIADGQVFIAAGYEDAPDRVVVVWRTEAVVPFHGVVYVSSLPNEIRVSLSAAFLSMTQTEQGIAALRETFQIDGMKLIDDTFYDELRRLLKLSGVSLSTLVR